MKETSTEITLDAPVERVWELLTDLALYPEWNPLFQKVSGSMVIGADLEILVHLPGMDPFPIKAKLLDVEPQRRIRWQNRLVCNALLSWSFAQEIRVISPERIAFVERSEFNGVLAPVFAFAMEKLVRQGMDELNNALKRWGEKGNVRCLRC